MKKIDLGQTITILANLGVIGGIVFLAFEIRQNTAQMRAEAAYSIHQDVQRMNESEYSDRNLVELLVRADEQYELLDAVDKHRVNAFYFSQINLADFVMGLEEEGLSDLIFRTEDFIVELFRESPGRRAFIESVYKPATVWWWLGSGR